MSRPWPHESEVRTAFQQAFRAEPEIIARAPGRVELLGNHTDYNGGLVFAAAIDRFTVVAGRAIPGRVARVRSLNFTGEAVFLIDAPERGEPGSWGRYVRGVVWALQEAYGKLESGFEAVILGDVPLGAGLSSSASVEAALALFLIAAGLLPEQNALLDPHNPARLDLAKALQKAENQFVGVASGLLDQFSSLFGQNDHALFLDCRSLDHYRVPLGSPAPALVVCDSKTSRRLADGMYNLRRQECERVVSYFHHLQPSRPVTTLRDITLEDIHEHWDQLDPEGRHRARHVLTENSRVECGVHALRDYTLADFGRLMSASHASSRDDFENSSPALEALIAAAQESPGFLGGKLSGAGWAGCTINLVEAGQAPAFAQSITAGYESRTGTTPDVHVCHASGGAAALPLD